MSDDVAKGWIVRVDLNYPDNVAYIQGVKRKPDGELISVCVTGPQVGNERRFVTHWISRRRWIDVFLEHLGETATCPACDKVPTVSGIFQIDDLSFCSMYECARCHHTWTGIQFVFEGVDHE